LRRSVRYAVAGAALIRPSAEIGVIRSRILFAMPSSRNGLLFENFPSKIGASREFDTVGSR